MKVCRRTVSMDWKLYPVFENSCGVKKSEVAGPVDFQKIQKNLVKFAKIRSNRV
jgi:hypothetical protein